LGKKYHFAQKVSDFELQKDLGGLLPSSVFLSFKILLSDLSFFAADFLVHDEANYQIVLLFFLHR
jgi:hypothetical protein